MVRATGNRVAAVAYLPSAVSRAQAAAEKRKRKFRGRESDSDSCRVESVPFGVGRADRDPSADQSAIDPSSSIVP